ncbi:MAG: MopE-related protein [Chitinophagales bacterium]
MKTISNMFFLLMLIFLNGVSAQNTFEKTYGTTGDNFANDVQLTSDGGYIIVGTGKFSGNNGDIFLLKTNSLGDTLWTRFIGGSSVDHGNSVKETADGGYIIAGSTVSFGAGASDAYLVKTDATGNVTWSKTYGTSSNDEAYGIVQTVDGGYVFSGTEKQSGLNGYAHLVKVDATGNVLWSKTFGNSTRKNFAYTLLQTADHGFVIGGWENLNLGINDDMCLIKTDSTGTLQWYKSYGDVGHDQNYSVRLANDGGFIIAGITFSAFIFEVNVVKTDAGGNLEWTRNIGGNAEDDAYAVTSTSDGGFVFCGTTSSFGTTHAGYMVKLNSAGSVLWSKTMGNSGWTGFFAIQEATDGGLILAGAKNEVYGASGNLYLVKTDANGNSGCNTSVISTSSTPSILVGVPVAHSTSIQSVNTVATSVLSGTSVTTICSSCDPTSWYQDLDADNYGNTAVTQLSCVKPAGFVANNMDCNDENAAIHPYADDVCNGIDDNCDGVADENAITAIVNPSGNVTLCNGSTISLDANIGSGIIYQWYKNSVAISGATNSSFIVSKKGNYYVSETNSYSCSSVSGTVNVSVSALPAAVITPLGNLNICIAGFVDLQATSGTGFTYQWIKGSSILVGATNQIFTATAKGNYKVKVTNPVGCSKTSLAVKVVKACKQGDGENENLHTTFTCYPNPSSGQFTIDLKLIDVKQATATIEISNTLNEKVFVEEVAMSDGTLNCVIGTDHHFSAGIYLVKVIAGNHVFSGRVVVVR